MRTRFPSLVVAITTCAIAAFAAAPQGPQALQPSTSKKVAADSSSPKNVNHETKGSSNSQSSSASADSPAASASASASSARLDTSAQSEKQSESPLSVKIGGADFTPFGFLDLTTVYRSTDVGSGIGTSFGSIPFNGASPAGRLSEIRFSAQNSRLGLKINANPSTNLKITGYVEADFLGAAPANLEVTSHSDTFRMRLYWVDVREGKWEFLGGQSWSMMTPNRKGISPMPTDIFYTQDMDTNYQVGLVWLRTPGVRVVYHANRKWTFGVALEDPEQFTGGLVTFPAGFNASQVDDTGGNAKTPNVAPDVIAKIAYDANLGSHAFHIEAAGLYRAFRLNTAATNIDVTRSAGGGSANVNFEAVKNLRLVGTSFWSDGGGRYIFGLGPDFVVKTDAAGNFVPSPLHAGSGIAGFEYQFIPQTMLYAYYGAAYFARDFQQVTAGTPPAFIGFGFPSSSSAQNRTIQEATLGVIQILWKNRKYGDLKIITQASYLSRNPWSNVATPAGARSAHLGMGFLDFRYDLP